ncbi:Tyrosine-protein kinase ITK/TSK [Liparis tanakae]|uniref:non-specific protein-tyrosine kinase n=1 Tax=Liparis tanakae TaxID=230148 RepID=A0A4Z2E9G6_9TELE|nr:Tyrosine-protein kinase ITK/TSK [Liparis tanakae]
MNASLCSALFRPNGEKDPRVKHYQIRQAESGEARFYLAEKYLFSTIPELIRYHQHNAADQWEVDPEQLTLGQELGSGQFGLVLEGRWRDKKVAVKTIREECMSEEEFKEEAGVMMRLSHCKLVQLYAVRTQRPPMCLVFEFMDNGCLSDFLRARRGHLSREAMSGMCLDVSEGMAYLESSNFIHRDLVKPADQRCNGTLNALRISVGNTQGQRAKLPLRNMTLPLMSRGEGQKTPP